MPPLDDELRAALSARADALTPLSDPFPGVARRARRLRRQRAAAAVAGSALAVLGLVGGAALVLPGATTVTQGPVATSPTAEPEPSEPAPAPEPTEPAEDPEPPAEDPFALDPQDPWELRGDPLLLEPGGGRGAGVVVWQDDYAARYPGSTLTPLYTEVYEPSGQVELVFVAVTAEGQARYGFYSGSEAGPELLVDEPLEAGTRALPFALPGDEVGRLLVVAAPRVGGVQYAPGGSDYRDMSAPVSGAPGVAVTALEGDPQADSFRVLDGDGDLDDPVVEAPAPDLPG